MKTNNKDETITSPHDQDIKTLENKQKGGKKLVTEENKNPSKGTNLYIQQLATLESLFREAFIWRSGRTPRAFCKLSSSM